MTILLKRKHESMGGQEFKFRFKRLHIETGSVIEDVFISTLPYEMARRAFYEALDRWNEIGFGIWQYTSK
jgi:hypothetical protein